MAEQTLDLDDLYVGRRFTSGVYHMEEAEIIEFATAYDPQPFHLDRHVAEASVFKGLAASVWHTAAVAMRLLTTTLPLTEGIIGVGGEIAWPRPTRPGDVVHLSSEIAEITPSKYKPNRAVVKVRGTMRNQNEEAVFLLTANLLVSRPTLQSEDHRRPQLSAPNGFD